MALVSVLWLTALLAVLAVGLTLLMRSGNLRAQAMQERAHAESLADAGIYLVLSDLLDPTKVKDIKTDGRAQDIAFEGITLRVAVQDEEGKVDLNFAAPETIGLCLRHAGLAEAAAQQAEAAIQKQREAHKFLFKTVEDLKKILELPEDVYRRATPLFTVYAQQPAIALSVAPRDVLEALPDMTPEKVKEVLEAREKETGNKLSIHGNADAREGRAFAITASFPDHPFARRAVVRLTGDLTDPYWVLDWRDEER